MEEIFNSRIEYLISKFKYEELSQEDKTYILESMTEQEYQAYRSIIVNSASMDVPAVPVGIQSALQKELQILHASKSNRLAQVINYKIPIWLFGMLGLLMFFVFYLFSPKHETIEDALIVQQEIEPKVIYKIDTVFKEIKAEPIVITKEVEKIVYLEREQKPSTINSFANNLDPASDEQEYSSRTNFFSDVEISEITISKPQGRPVSQDEALMDLLDDLEPSMSMK